MKYYYEDDPHFYLSLNLSKQYKTKFVIYSLVLSEF